MRLAAPALLVSLALSTAMVLRSPHPGATLDPTYTDSMRSIYSSWLFLRQGWDVYRQTLGDLAARDDSSQQHTPWPKHPFVYPPGALLLYVPFGWAEYGLRLPEMAVHRAAVLFSVLLGHLSVVVFVRRLGRQGGSLALLLSALYAMVALQFSLNGFFDPAYVAAAALGIGAAERREPARSLLWFSLAGFLHYRALFYLPVAATALGRLGAEGLWRSQRLRLALAALLAVSSAWTFHVTAGLFGATGAINLALEEDFGWGGVLVVSLATVAASAYFLVQGERLAGLSVAWAGALALALPFSRAWHSLALYPLILLVPAEGRKREVALLWALVVSSIAFRYFPSLRWLARGLGILTG